MSKAEKASEPTMDEILASIRKIIAEEPAGARTAGDGGGRDEGEKRVHPAPRATLDDILGMADSKPSGERPAELRADGFSWPLPSGPRAGAAGRAASEREPPMFPAPSGTRSQPAAGSDGKSAGEVTREASQRSADLGTIIPRKPVDQAAELSVDRKPQAGRLPDWLSRPTPLQPPLASELPPPTLPGELQRATTSGTPAGSQVAASGEAKAVIAPPPSPAAETSLAKDTPTPPQVPLPKTDVVMAAQPVPKAPAGPLNAAEAAAGKPAGADKDRAAVATPPTTTALSQSGVATPAIPPSTAHGPGGDGKSPVPAQPAKAAPASPQERAAAATAVGGAPQVQSKEGTEPGDPRTSKTASSAGSLPAAGTGAPAKASGAAAAGETAKTSVPASASPAVEQGAAKAVAAAPTGEPAKAAAPPATNVRAAAPVPVAEPATAVAKPAVMADKAKVAKVSAAELVSGAAGGGVRTLDDTIIELLRPMIRQWLDDNMPRMVEKALRIELAASLQAKGEAAKGDASKH